MFSEVQEGSSVKHISELLKTEGKAGSGRFVDLKCFDLLLVNFDNSDRKHNRSASFKIYPQTSLIAFLNLLKVAQVRISTILMAKGGERLKDEVGLTRSDNLFKY